MYNYMTSHTPSKDLWFTFIIFLSHTHSDKMFIHEQKNETRIYENWRVASHGVDINLINMMMKWTWNESFAVFWAHMNEIYKNEESEREEDNGRSFMCVQSMISISIECGVRIWVHGRK